jgi:carbamoyltransferase
MYILGISAYYHDSAAALICDGEIIAAAQEERFTRIKHDSVFPKASILNCLDFADIDLCNVDYIAFYDKPFLKFERLIETYVAFAPIGFQSFSKSISSMLDEKLFLKDRLLHELTSLSPNINWESRLLFSEHHLSHAASAFFPSPFEEAAVLTLDGVGEWTTTSLALGSGSNLEVFKEIHFPNSIGLLYSAFTYYLGFKVNSGEYKMMGLAPYGKPLFKQLILDNLIDIKPDGSFRLDQSYFNYCVGLTMTSSRFHDLFGALPRKPEEKLEQRHMDLAASIQAVTEEVVIRLSRSIRKETNIRNLCLAGGVALNCVANSKLLIEGSFDNLWIQPAAGDSGGALGAALAIYHIHLAHKRVTNGQDKMKGSYLGPEFEQAEIEKRLNSVGANFLVMEKTSLIETCSTALLEGKALGWFQGRMEFGPRALGGRSILGDARSPSMQSLLNNKVKFRESFRPFAPSVLSEDLSAWFELNVDSPYMLLVANVSKNHRFDISESEEFLFGLDRLKLIRSEIPAATHVDYSARIQTVHVDTNPLYHSLISNFKLKTGCPLILNTSFNVRGEPIVCSPEDAYRCFMGTDIDVLAIGNCWLDKKQQLQNNKERYERKFELD